MGHGGADTLVHRLGPAGDRPASALTGRAPGSPPVPLLCPPPDRGPGVLAAPPGSCAWQPGGKRSPSLQATASRVRPRVPVDGPPPPAPTQGRASSLRRLVPPASLVPRSADAWRRGHWSLGGPLPKRGARLGLAHRSRRGAHGAAPGQAQLPATRRPWEAAHPSLRGSSELGLNVVSMHCWPFPCHKHFLRLQWPNGFPHSGIQPGSGTLGVGNIRGFAVANADAAVAPVDRCPPGLRPHPRLAYVVPAGRPPVPLRSQQRFCAAVKSHF